MTSTITSLTALKGVAWYFNGQPISSSKISIVNSNNLLGALISTITITGVASTNAGAYTVHATNTIGTTISSPVNLVVQNLANTVVSSVTNVVSFVSAETAMTVNGFNIKLSGPTGSNVVIEASSDLKTWVPISTNLVSAGSVSYTDTAAKAQPLRYYRAFIQ